MPREQLIILSGCPGMVVSKKPKLSIPSGDPTAANIDYTPWLLFKIKTRLLTYANVLVKHKLISDLKNTWTHPQTHVNVMERCFQWPLETIRLCSAMGKLFLISSEMNKWRHLNGLIDNRDLDSQ